MLIGISGYKGSGKSTLGLIIKSLSEEPVTLKAFAEPLKSAASSIFGFSLQSMEDPILKEQVDSYWGFSPRHALQVLGTECIRDHFGPETWVKAAFKEGLPNSCVFTDVRFQSEIDAIKDRGGDIWRIQRPGCHQGSHPSEQSGDLYYDALIHNDGDLVHLGEEVRKQLNLLERLKNESRTFEKTNGA